MDDPKELIYNAFKDMKLGKGKSIRQCMALDNYFPEDSPKFLDIKDYTNWQDIPDEQLERIGTHGVYVFTRDDGVLFHLPAAMIYCLKYYKGFFSSTNKVRDVYVSTIICLEKEQTQALFNRKQLEAIKDFLRYFIMQLNSDVTDIRELYDIYNKSIRKYTFHTTK